MVRDFAQKEAAPVIREYDRKGAIIYEGSSEIPSIIQAGYALGERDDKPLRREMPAYDENEWQS